MSSIFRVLSFGTLSIIDVLIKMDLAFILCELSAILCSAIGF